MGMLFTTNSSILLFIKNSNLSNTTHTALALTGAIRGASREKFSRELGLESLRQR